jgi:hypothetical protein
MTERLMIAYGLIALMIVALAAIVWWNLYHSYPRKEARERARRRAAERLRDKL